MDIWWRSYTGWMTVGVFDDFDSDMSLQIGPNSWASADSVAPGKMNGPVGFIPTIS